MHPQIMTRVAQRMRVWYKNWLVGRYYCRKLQRAPIESSTRERRGRLRRRLPRHCSPRQCCLWTWTCSVEVLARRVWWSFVGLLHRP
jgi:hypothetical protein